MSQDLLTELGGGEKGSGPRGAGGLRAPCAMPLLVGTGRGARGGLGPGPSPGEEVCGFEGVGASHILSLGHAGWPSPPHDLWPSTGGGD